MKSIIGAIVFLLIAGTTLAADGNDSCSLQCTQSSGNGNWSGESSVILEFGVDTRIIIETDLKIFGVINFQYNLFFGVKGNFFVVLNTKTGVYILVDVTTGYAVYGKINITISKSSSTTEISKFITQINVILTKYTTITSSTSGSFNFSLFVTAIFSANFDLTLIYSKEIVAVFEGNFSIWIKLIRTAVAQGALVASGGFWVLLGVIIGVETKFGVLIMEVVKVSITVYREIAVKLFVQLVKVIRYRINILEQYVSKIVAIVSVMGNISIDTLLNYVNNKEYDAQNYEIVIGKTTYTVSVYNIKGMYVIKFYVKENGKINGFALIYTNKTLIIVNYTTNVVVLLQGKSIGLVNRTSSISDSNSADIVLTIKFNNGIGVGASPVVSATNDTQFVALLRSESWAEAATEFKEIVKQNNSSGKKVKIEVLADAIVKGDKTTLNSLLGCGELSGYVVLSFQGYFSASGSIKSSGDLIAGVFGSASNNVFVKIFVNVLSTGFKAGADFSGILKSLQSAFKAAGQVKVSASVSVSV